MAKKAETAKGKPKTKGETRAAAPASAPRVTEEDLASFSDDVRNANAGNERGHALLEKSIARLGAGRSILVDKHGRTIAGNKTREALGAAGMRSAIVVETDGTRPVVVRRTDLDLDERNGLARELAYADNRVGEIDLTWDSERLAADLDVGIDLSAYFSERELEQLIAAAKAGDFDPTKEWDGMPEFDQDDKTAVRRIVVNFKSNADAIEFGNLLHQPITDKTRSMWYPAVPIDRLMDKRYEVGEEGEVPADEEPEQEEAEEEDE